MYISAFFIHPDFKPSFWSGRGNWVSADPASEETSSRWGSFSSPSWGLVVGPRWRSRELQAELGSYPQKHWWSGPCLLRPPPGFAVVIRCDRILCLGWVPVCPWVAAEGTAHLPANPPTASTGLVPPNSGSPGRHMALTPEGNSHGDIFSILRRICQASTINFFLLRTQRGLYLLSEYNITSHSKACRDWVFKI